MNMDIEANNWADSVLKSLSKEQRIAQLIIVRLSTIDSKTKQVTFFDDKVAALIKKYNIGGICLFQGGPVKQTEILNRLQQLAQTPVLISIDAEWGVGMRLLDSVLPLPKQMMLGAMKDQAIVYKYGQVVAEQCKRMGVQVNYAPVVDVNNNPNNPIINDRSFGEDKYKVARYGIQYMKGLQDLGVMACAKHFPGHGDVSVDSHLDLPVINKSIQQLDSLELYPFRQLVNAGVGSAMVAHLYIPAIDNRPNRPTSLSKANVTDLLRNNLQFQGLILTDGLEMQGVKKYFPDGEVAVESLKAGNDMLCLPDDAELAIIRIKKAADDGILNWDDINLHCKNVLLAKYQYGLSNLQPVKTDNLTADLNREIGTMTKLIAENALTLLSDKDSNFFPLKPNTSRQEIAYVGVGISSDNAFASRMRNDYNAAVYYFDYDKKNPAEVTKLVESLKGYKQIVIGVHNMSRSPATNFGLSTQSISLLLKLQQLKNSISFVFGNAYSIKNFCNASNLVLCYEDDPVIQNTAVDMLKGDIPYKGVLPVSVCDKFQFGFGLTAIGNWPQFQPNQWGFKSNMNAAIDSIVTDAIEKKATPGCVVMLLKDGRIAFEQAYGYYTYDSTETTAVSSVYDMASVTKMCVTTISLMKLYDEGKFDFKKKLVDYLPEVAGTNKANIRIENLLLHQAGLVPYIPFYKETLDATGKPLESLYRQSYSDSFNIRVANELYLRKDWKDSIYKRVLRSPVGAADKYVYSDIGFILLGKVVEAISKMSLDEYVRKKFYDPMSLESSGFFPRNHITIKRLVPTEEEKQFRTQLLRGDVHDPGAALLGGMAGHAGLFSDAYDMAAIMQMLLNGGVYNNRRFLEKGTVDLFTAYHSNISRRGYGFDKPEKDNLNRIEPYPALSASPKTFGHSGFTGTAIWADPEKKLVFVFLSNRLNPNSSDLLLKMNIRLKILQAVYESLGNVN